MSLDLLWIVSTWSFTSGPTFDKSLYFLNFQILYLWNGSIVSARVGHQGGVDADGHHHKAFSFIERNKLISKQCTELNPETWGGPGVNVWLRASQSGSGEFKSWLWCLICFGAFPKWVNFKEYFSSFIRWRWSHIIYEKIKQNNAYKLLRTLPST